MNPHFFALPFDESTGQDGTFGKVPRFEVVGEMRGHPILQEKAEIDIMFLLRSISDEFFRKTLPRCAQWISYKDLQVRPRQVDVTAFSTRSKIARWISDGNLLSNDLEVAGTIELVTMSS